MGKAWICFCGSEDLEITHSKTIGKWRVNALCKSCGRHLVITKHGISASPILEPTHVHS